MAMIRLLACLFLLLLASRPAEAVSAYGMRCQGLNTTTFSTTGAMVLLSCTVQAGPSGNIWVEASAENACSTDAQIQLLAGSGSSPVAGSAFTGSITSGVLFVSALASGVGAAPWLIQPGQTLFDRGGGVASGVTIVSQNDGTLGGTGHYILSGTQPNVAAENMFTLNAPPGGATPISNALKQTQCISGYRAQSIVGAYTGTPGATYWIGLSMLSLSGTWVDWNNSYLAIFGF